MVFEEQIGINNLRLDGEDFFPDRLSQDNNRINKNWQLHQNAEKTSIWRLKLCLFLNHQRNLVSEYILVCDHIHEFGL